MRGLGGARRAGLATAAVLLAGALAACNWDGNEGKGDRADDGASASASPRASEPAEEKDDGGGEEAAAKPDLTTVAEPSDRIMVGQHPYVSPCRLLAPGDVQRLFPLALHVMATADQTYVDTSPTVPQVRRNDGVLVTKCSVEFEDKGDHSFVIEVDQFLKPQAAKKAWDQIRHLGTGKDSESLEGEDGLDWLADLARDNEEDMGGQLVSDKLLYVPGRHDYVTHARNLLIRMRYDTVIQSFEDKPLTAKQYAFQTPKMKKAAKIVQRNAADRSLSQAPVPTILGPEKANGATAYLEPCQVLDVALAKEIIGHAINEPVTSHSLYLDTETFRDSADADDVYAGTAYNSCERTTTVDGPWGYAHGTATLEVRYAPDAEQATKVMQDWMVVRAATYAKRDQYDVIDLERAGLVRRRDDTAADDAYVYDTKYLASKVGDYRGTSMYFTAGPYVFNLKGRVPQKDDDVPLEPDAYLPFVQQIVDRLPTDGS